MTRLKAKGTACLFLILVVCYCSFSCTKKTQAYDSQSSYSREIAKIISHATNGMLGTTEPIIIRFVNPEIPPSQVNTKVDSHLFDFSPSIEGSAKWQDTRTLVFQPKERLPFQTIYSGLIYFNKLLAKYQNMKPIRINFFTFYREILSINADFQLVKALDPSWVKFQGVITFTEPIKLEQVKQAVSFSNEDKGIPLDWSIQKENQSFFFSSKPIQRITKLQKFSLLINKEKGELQGKFKRNFLLPALKDMEVTEVRKFTEGEQPGLEITFSDELAPQQDKTGLIRVIRDKTDKTAATILPIELKTMKKSIYVEGKFTYNESLTLKISGIQSKWGTRLKNEYVETFSFKDKKPELAFLNNGLFLPSTNRQKIGFKTINLKRVHLSIQQVFESNLGQFLQTEKINAGKTRNAAFNWYYIERVGVEVINKTLEIGNTKNKWFSMQLDLEKLIKRGEKGLFIVRLYFTQEDMLVNFQNNNREEYNEDESDGDYNYYQNNWYRYNNIYKPVIVSDIGLTVKQGETDSLCHIFATDIVNATPMAGVKITLRTFQNQIITSGVTNSEGKVVLNKAYQPVYYIEGEKEGQRSFVLPNEMSWNISSFDTGGTEYKTSQTSAYIYTERGVYRPGDEINLCLIARNPDHSFPANHPVSMNVYNPKKQVVFNKTENSSSDGFYHFVFTTKPEDLTGNWLAEFVVGTQIITHPIKIETVAPYRLKVNLSPDKKQYTTDETQLNLTLQSNYLFGNPAANLKAHVTMTLMQGSTSFPRYPGFMFDNEGVKFQNIQGTLYENPLDENGHATMQWDIPDLSQAPGPLTAQVIAKVFEQGGSASRNDIYIPIHPFSQYIGLQKPLDWTQVGIDVVIPTVLLNQNGDPLAGRHLKYTIYKNDSYWWWEYENVRDFRVRFRNDSCTRIIKEGQITTQKTAVNIIYNPKEYGEFFIEVEEADRQGHRAGFFFSSWDYSETNSGSQNASIGTLSLGVDKKIYHPGETATVFFPTPGNGLAIVTLEKNSRILNSWLYQTSNLETIQSGNNHEAAKCVIKIPVTKEMLPNAYISVSVIQAHAQTINDRPIRMFGIVPILVEDPDNQQQLTITSANSLRSNEPFDISIATSDGKPTQFTIAVVDEGLLDITHFETPNPWAYFFQKQRLAINTFDLFSFVIGANKGDIFRLFSIGGDRDNGASYRSSQLETEKNKRFKPISLFKGPLSTDARGRAKVSFTMPDYIGSVRIMVISARGNCYGHAEKTVPVKTPLMILPKLPRTITPGDKFAVPVSVFALENTLKNAKVSIQVSGPVDIVGAHSVNLNFAKPGEQNVCFYLNVRQEIGQAKVTISATAPQMSVKKETSLMVHANSPRIYGSQLYSCEPGSKLEILIPQNGLPGSNKATITILRKQELKLNHRLDWLIHYPYGCIEQTTSTAFPQLYLKSFLKKSPTQEKEIDHNINGGIQRLRFFLTSAGAFAYWPGDSDAHIWGTNYGFHFLLEAKKLGYFVPADMFTALLKFQKARALTENDSLLERTYRLYLLALAGEPQIGPMNLLKENALNQMNNTEKYLLSAAYFISGRQGVSKSILALATADVNQYSENDNTFGSALRDQAIMLETSILRKDWYNAGNLYNHILKELANESWYSTQSLGYSLLAVGKYISLFEDNRKNPFILGTITLPGGNPTPFKTANIKYAVDIEKGFGKNAVITVDRNSPRVFILIEWNGVPMNYEAQDVSKNLSLEVRWLDENGSPLDPSSLKQGTTFWGHFRVRLLHNNYSYMNEMALVQVLPSGWEIENTRLLKEEKPQFMKEWILDREEYLDIRDDRVMWFFDLPRDTTYDFVVKLNAVTIGNFTLPPTLFEAMYDANYQAIKANGKVEVK